MDDEAVVNAVNSGKLSGAGIDCVEEEPAKPGSLILENPNIIVTPHVGGGSADISDVMFPMITEKRALLSLMKCLRRTLPGSGPPRTMRRVGPSPALTNSICGIGFPSG